MTTECDFEHERILFAAQSAIMIDKLKHMLELTKKLEEALRAEIREKEQVVNMSLSPPRKRSRL